MVLVGWVFVVAITGNVRRRLFGDHLIVESKGAGLPHGSMRGPDVEAVDRSLRRCLAL